LKRDRLNEGKRRAKRPQGKSESWAVLLSLQYVPAKGGEKARQSENMTLQLIQGALYGTGGEGDPILNGFPWELSRVNKREKEVSGGVVLWGAEGGEWQNAFLWGDTLGGGPYSKGGEGKYKIILPYD